MKCRIFFVVLFLASRSVFGVSDLYRATLRDHIGAKEAGMGFSTIAREQDGASLLQNPAGLVTKGHYYTYEQMDLQSQNFPTGAGHFFRMGNFGLASIHAQNKYSQKLSATLVSYSQKGKNNLDWGVLYKNWHETATSNTQAWSADLGVVLHFGKSLHFGLTVYDAIAGSPEAAPTSVGFGSLVQFGDLDFSLETVFRQDPLNTAGLRMGASCLVSDGLVVRAGWFNRLYTVGATLSLPFFDVSYAALYPEDRAQTTQYLFSVSVIKEVSNASPSVKKK